MDERICYIALCWGAELGRRTVDRLIRHFGSAAQVLASSPAVLRSLGVGDDRARGISRLANRLQQVEEELVLLAEEGIEVLCPFDEGFPVALERIPNPPPLLSVRGTLCASDRKSIAIVGTRYASEEGREAALMLAGAAAANGWCVVSGLALGIDTAAHEGALSAGGRTIAVLGSGIRHVYPYQNEELADRIAEQGAVISERPPNARPSVRRLTTRNRLQSGLARAVIVVETGATGGSHITASQGRRQHKPVFAVQWPGSDRRAQGAAQLLARGAYPADAAGDLSALLAAIDRVEEQRRSRSKEQLDLW